MVEDAIKVWEFYDGPKDLQALSGFDGEEEWMIQVPEHFVGSMPPSHDGWPDLPIHVERFIIRGTDTSSVEWHELEDGDWIAITSRG